MKKNKKIPPAKSPGTALETIVEEDLSINSMLRLTVDKLRAGEDAVGIVTAIEKLVELEDRISRRNAEKEFNNALAEFQNECPQIPKTKSTKKVSSAGGGFGFMYAPLDVVEKTIKPHLYIRGFSYYWDGETTFIEGKFLRKETCHLLHRNGHQISSSISAPITKEVGSMNEVQRFGTVGSYLKRYSLLAVLGVPTADVDTDAESPETIDEKEIKVLKSKIKKKGLDETDEKRFFEYMGVKDYSEIRKVDLSKAALALDMYEKGDKPPEKAAKKSEPAKKSATTKKKAASSPSSAGVNINTLRTRAHTKLNEAINIKAEGYKPPTRSKWEPLINNAKTAKDIDRLISNLSVFIDEAGSDGKLKL